MGKSPQGRSLSLLSLVMPCLMGGSLALRRVDCVVERIGVSPTCQVRETRFHHLQL